MEDAAVWLTKKRKWRAGGLFWSEDIHDQQCDCPGIAKASRFHHISPERLIAVL